MLFMNQMEPVRYMAAENGLIVEFCCDFNGCEDNSQAIQYAKTIFEQLGYQQANVGFNKYKATNNVGQFYKVGLLHCHGNGRFNPIGIFVCYVGQGIEDPDKIKEITDTLINMYKGLFSRSVSGTLYYGKEVPTNG